MNGAFLRPELAILGSACLFACGPSVAKIDVEPSSVVLTEKGRTATLKADPKDPEGKTVIDAVLKVQWSSSAPEIALVNNGVVAAVKSGNAKVMAKVGSVVGTTEVVVSIPAKLSLDPARAEILGVEKQLTLNALVFDEVGRPVANQPIIWSTGNSDVANISEGVVTASGPGSTVIRATLRSLSTTATITVKLPPVDKVTIDPPSASLAKEGEAIRLKAIALDAQGQEIKGVTASWSTSEEKIATVSETGQVQAGKKKGTTKIKATIDGKTGEAEISVQQ